MNWIDIVIIVGTLGGTVLGLLLMQRFVPHPVREAHNDVAGFIFAVVGVLYAVLLAFIVIAVWENVDTAKLHTFKEADALAGVYWMSRQEPLPQGGKLERLTLDYAHRVIDSEWALMANHQSDPQATALMYEIRDTALSNHPTDAKSTVEYDHLVTHVEDLASERRARLAMIENEVPPLLWIAIIVGAVVTIGFTFLFGLSRTWVHVGMALSLAVLVILSIIAIRALDYPFGGLYQVHPTAFEVFLTRLPPPR